MSQTNRSLSSVLAYEHCDLVRRFARKFDLHESESADLFTDLKLWLFLVGTSDATYRPPAFPALQIIDEMWHEFMLYSEDYTRFCREFFGQYLHHYPTTDAERFLHDAAMAQDRAAEESRLQKELATLIRYVYDTIGEETAIRWFRVLPKQYPGDRIRSLQIDALQKASGE